MIELISKTGFNNSIWYSLKKQGRNKCLPFHENIESLIKNRTQNYILELTSDYILIKVYENTIEFLDDYPEYLI